MSMVKFGIRKYGHEKYSFYIVDCIVCIVEFEIDFRIGGERERQLEIAHDRKML
jgi:hypothetical protein